MYFCVMSLTTISLRHSKIGLNSLSKGTCMYISGQMSGLPDLGEKRLGIAEKRLVDYGFVSVMNPFKMVDQSKNLAWADCMRIDIRDIMNFGVGGMILIDNWMGSKGATLEVILFLVLGIPIFDEGGNNITDVVYNSFTPEFLYDKFRSMVETHMTL